MSGFEVAGIVLGSVPLLISGLEHYRDGVETIGNMVQYEEAVNTLLVSVSTNLVIYRQSCEEFLEKLDLPEKTFNDLVNNPNSVPSWMNTGEADPTMLEKYFNSKRKKMLLAINIGFNHNKYMLLAEAIESDVNRIRTLIEGVRTLESLRADRKSKEAAKYWLNIRDCAQRLFASLSLPQAKDPTKCLGLLNDDIWQHFLYLASPGQGSEGRYGFSSLEQVLNDPESMGTRTKWDASRFKIAAALASAVLQFHATPWLNNDWDSAEIYFLRGRDKYVQTDRPYVSKHFAKDQSHVSNSKSRDPCVSNEITFALGVALLELSYGRRLLDFQQPEDLDKNGDVYALTKFLIAKRLVQRLDNTKREPSNYVDVVDRCVRCRFDTISTSLEDPTFLTLFYKGVIQPLQDIYNSLL
ncbi:hypothetical protein F53441_10734 [Fusarium austroafricanum]|uniref:DUF7580 domain-containing protein n=1 Tax=Fusarium austroafricanum TaxID=2364996 RepID=A0A8H4K6B0_9HYPO|nr:hypothetical protein F53441_10734 [Fusarium austroafricanum]